MRRALPIVTKTVKGRGYLYFREYDPITKKNWDRYCGPADDPVAKALARDYERKFGSKWKTSRHHRLTTGEVEVEILRYLSTGKGDDKDISSALNIGLSSVREATESLMQRRLLWRDKSEEYRLTEEGRKWSREVLKEKNNLSYLASAIARHADMIPTDKIDKLKDVYDSVLKSLRQGKGERARGEPNTLES